MCFSGESPVVGTVVAGGYSVCRRVGRKIGFRVSGLTRLYTTRSPLRIVAHFSFRGLFANLGRARNLLKRS